MRSVQGISRQGSIERFPFVKFQLLIISLILILINFESVSCAQGSQQGPKNSSSKDRSDDGDSAPASGNTNSGGKYSSASKSYLSSSPSSSYYNAYPSGAYTGHYLPSASAGNIDEPYYETYYERPRQFNARSSIYPTIAAASSQIGFTEPEYGGLAAATGHSSGHGHGGHYQGQGHGHGHGGHGHGGWSGGGHTTYYEKVHKVDNSASFGLLGLLGLLSLLSNVLMMITTTAATTAAPAPAPAPGRRKRDTNRIVDDEEETKEIGKIKQVCQMILPSLNIVGHVRNGVIPKNCSHQEICKANKILMNEYGLYGRTVGTMLSKAIIKMLSEIDQSKTKAPGQDKYLLKASLDGRNGDDCEKVYPTCKALENNRGVLPQLISPAHVSAILQGENPNLFAPNNSYII